MGNTVTIIGAGLAGSEAALQLACRGVSVRLVEMRPERTTAVHHTGDLAELVCSNSLKSTNPHSAAGMLKEELDALGSVLYRLARVNSVAAGGALAVDRRAFSKAVTDAVCKHPRIELVRREASDIASELRDVDALVLASGPLTSGDLSNSLLSLTGREHMAFYDAAAPIVMSDSLDHSKLFRQSRYEEGTGDYLNAPMSKEEYDSFISELLEADRVIDKAFGSKDLFQACQPIEEVARSGADAPRFGALKPVGLVDPVSGKRPWAALQLRAEDGFESCYNLVGFQTNLTFPEQRRVFRMIPGLEQAEFARYGVMHRNTFIDAPRLLDASCRLISPAALNLRTPIFVAGQLSGTEGYCEAIRSGLHVALAIVAELSGRSLPSLPLDTVFGSLLAYSTDSRVVDYQPMHVNFGILPPLDQKIKNKKERYAAYALRGRHALHGYVDALREVGLTSDYACGCSIQGMEA